MFFINPPHPTGQATAEAKARAEAAQIEGEAAVKQAELKAEASRIESEAQLAQLKARQEGEISHQKALHQVSSISLLLDFLFCSIF